MNKLQKDILAIKSLYQMKGIFVSPTDTVWGLSTWISNKNGIDTINKLKDRSKDQNFILLVNSLKMLKKYILEIPEQYLNDLNAAKQPISFIYQASDLVPDYLRAKDGTIAIRICKNKLIAGVTSLYNEAIISTSANYSGEKTPNNFKEIDESIFEKVDYVCHYMRTAKTKQGSSQLKTINEKGELIFLRK